MNHLWLFYPENDIALAHGTANFSPPQMATNLRRSAEILPLWMAGNDDKVLCHGINKNWLDNICMSYNITADVWNHTDYNLLPTPWGWSAASRAIFIHEGFKESTLPDMATIEQYRNLSHRRTAAIVTNEVSKLLDFTIYPPAIEVADTDTLSRIINDKKSAVLKSPWSSSGRGVRFVDHNHLQQALSAAAGTIRKQKSIMVEDYVNPHFDFALLFECKDSVCDFVGYSLFRADPSSGQYTGNIVADQQELRTRIASKSDSGQLSQMITALQSVISAIIAPAYSGPVGVDMLADINGKMHIVELNLRYTMGFMALGLERFVGREAIFYMQKGDGSSQNCPVIEQSRLYDGIQMLTPPGGDFSFMLKIV